MKGASLSIVIAVWVVFWGWVVEKIGKPIPDRSMRLLVKFLLFVIFTTAPLLSLMAKAAELCASGTWIEHKAQWCEFAMSVYGTRRKGAP